MGFSRQEHWSRLPCTPPRDLLDLGIKPLSPASGFVTHLESPSLTAAAVAKSLQSCPTLCDPRDGSPPGSPIPGILQARTLEWVAIPFSNAWKWKVKVKTVISDPQRPHGLQPSYIHGIFQARVPEWGAIAFSKPSLTTLIQICLQCTWGSHGGPFSVYNKQDRNILWSH